MAEIRLVQVAEMRPGDYPGIGNWGRVMNGLGCA